VTDPDFWAAVSSKGKQGVCDFCSSSGSCVTFEDLATVLEDVLEQHYLTVEESGAFHDEGEWSERVFDVQEILDEILWNAVGGDVLQPLVQYVAGRNAVAYGFVRKRDVWAGLYDSHEGEWRNFMRRARSGDVEAAAADLTANLNSDLLELFRNIETVARLEGLFRSASPKLWRCRPGPAEPGYRSAADLGSAPSGHAGANRMTPEGHSAFYGSTSLRGALIEVAKHHGEDATMWAGRFDPSRPVYYLDVMHAPELPSVFAPGAVATFDALRFLARFAETVSQPNDGEPRHYLPTQIFVAYLLANPAELRPDAIRFASSLEPQSENWVVFADHDHCVDSHAPDGELCMLLDTSTVRFVAGRASPGPESPVRGG
jgi:hypothetical protein